MTKVDKMGIKQFHLVCTFIIWSLFSIWNECSKNNLGTVVIFPLIVSVTCNYSDLRWPCKIGTREAQPQNQLLLFAKCEPNSCTDECNYVVRLPIRPVKEVYHVIIFMCIALWFIFCKVNANRCNVFRPEMSNTWPK